MHGFGFASALTDIGLPQGDIPLALFSFNVGVEVGQLIFTGAVLAVLAAARRIDFPPQSNAMRCRQRPMRSERWRRSGSSSD